MRELQNEGLKPFHNADHKDIQRQVLDAIRNLGNKDILNLDHSTINSRGKTVFRRQKTSNMFKQMLIDTQKEEAIDILKEIPNAIPKIIKNTKIAITNYKNTKQEPLHLTGGQCFGREETKVA